MATVIEAPPQPKKGFGCCLGKGCLILVVLFLLLVMTFIVGGYIGTRHAFTSTEPRQLPEVPTSEAQQEAVLQRWDQFQNVVHHREAPPPESAQQSGTPAATPTAENPTIQFTAADINQLISANRKARGKAFVTIADGVGHVAVSIPLTKLGLSGRYLNADFEVRSSPDGNPSNIQVTTSSSRGLQVPERVLNLMSGFKTLHSYLDGYVNQYRSDYQVSKVRIVGDRVLLEANQGE